MRYVNTAYASIKPYSAYKLSPYCIRYSEIKFHHIRRINTIDYTGTCLIYSILESAGLAASVIVAESILLVPAA